MSPPSVIDYLQQLQRQGVTHVNLDEEARSVMRELYTRSLKKTPPSSTITVTGQSPAERISSLKNQAAQWAPARSLETLRDTLVFSSGNPEADLMLIGEAPGYQEEKKGAPFVGPAGIKLDQILTAMGLHREEIYLSCICKFRPSMPNQTTSNRPPNPQEMAACLPFIHEEINIVRPSVIIALGATAAHGLLHSESTVDKLRNQWHQFNDISLRVTYHPSYLLHNEEGLAEKRKVWEDMLAVMEKLGRSISEKQRSFFLPK